MEPVKTEKKKNPVGPAKVELTKSHGAYQLLVNGNPFYLHGAGLEFGDIPALARHGGNSFRTWRTENGKRSASEILDEAHAHGLMVCMGLEVGRERHGFDYDDKRMVRAQLDRIRDEVLTLKDHPALLMWGIGNELNLKYINPAVWDAVDEISQMIHEVDPNHPTTTSLAGIHQNEIRHIQERCPNLDLLSFQMYGNLPDLPGLVKKFGWTGPYAVTEWGATGHWEVPRTSWGAPVEENSTVKASRYLERYESAIVADPEQCLGSFVFLWGQKQERTPTWYGIFLEDGRETESVDVMHYLWNGQWPENRAPRMRTLLLDGLTAQEDVTLRPGVEYPAEVVLDMENDHYLRFSWEVLRESEDLQEGGDYEARPDSIEGAIVPKGQKKAEVMLQETGHYRLFVYVWNDHNKAATANIPFRVISE
jgi:hypothetical protein